MPSHNHPGSNTGTTYSGNSVPGADLASIAVSATPSGPAPIIVAPQGGGAAFSVLNAYVSLNGFYKL
jgi:hypothetical protein